MAYISQTEKQIIVQAIKPIMQKYGFKATFSTPHNSTFCVNIKSGNLDVIQNYTRATIKNNRHFANFQDRLKHIEYIKLINNINVNTYSIDSNYYGNTRKFLNELLATIKSSGNWYNNSDTQTDYFHIAFYIDINFVNYKNPIKLLQKDSKQ